MTYRIKFIDSVRFLASSLSRLPDNLAEGLHNSKCKDCKLYLQYVNVKDGLLLCNCSDCNKNYEKEFNKDLAKRFESTYGFCLILQKCVYHLTTKIVGRD